MTRLSTNTSYVQVRISYWIVIATLTFLAFWALIKDWHKCIWDLSTFQGFIWLLTGLYFDITRAIFHAILTLGLFVTEINFASFGIEPWVNNHIHINWIVITKFSDIWLGQRWNRQVDKWHQWHNGCNQWSLLYSILNHVTNKGPRWVLPKMFCRNGYVSSVFLSVFNAKIYSGETRQRQWQWQWINLYCQVTYKSCSERYDKTKRVIGLLYMQYVEPGKRDVKPSWLMCPMK